MPTYGLYLSTLVHEFIGIYVRKLSYIDSKISIFIISSPCFIASKVLKVANGKTIEVTNTDAEGRLVLADCLTYSTFAHRFH